jgi:hypothetical protein
MLHAWVPSSACDSATTTTTRKQPNQVIFGEWLAESSVNLIAEDVTLID